MQESIPNLRHLAAFRAAAERGSLSAAAAVHLTQAAVADGGASARVSRKFAFHRAQ
jgi:hypothetical protein